MLAPTATTPVLAGWRRGRWFDPRGGSLCEVRVLRSKIREDARSVGRRPVLGLPVRYRSGTIVG